jgi:hypothetical protein
MKPQALVGVISAIFVGCLGMAALRAQNGQGNDQGGDDSRIQVGFKYAHDQGISLDLKGKNRALVGLGSYLVNGVGGCNDCHTAPPYTQDPDHPGQVLQVMPWPVYQTMTDRDLTAVYEYLSSIPPIQANICGAPSE